MLQLQGHGVDNKAQLRILLWLDGFPVPYMRIEPDLLAQLTPLAAFTTRLGPTAADQIVMEIVRSDQPTSFVRWARQLVPDRQLLEDAFVQMSQVGLGARPADLMLDEEAARPLHAILSGMFPGMVNDVNQLVEVFDDPEFNTFVGELATFSEWSLADWREARDAQIGVALEPPEDIRGAEYFAFRFSLLLASGAAARHARRQRGKVAHLQSPDQPQKEAS